MEEALDSSRFKESGFHNILTNTKNGEVCIRLRINATDRLNFERWKDIFCELTCCSLNSQKRLSSGEGHRNAFGQVLVCCYKRKSKGKKKICTECPFKLTVTIKKVTLDKMKKDRLLKSHPCFITISGEHNHSTTSADALKQLRVLPAVRSALDEYFEQGMGAAQASRAHSLRMEAEGNLEVVVRNDTNPSKRSFAHYLDVWRKNNRGRKVARPARRKKSVSIVDSSADDPKPPATAGGTEAATGSGSAPASDTNIKVSSSGPASPADANIEVFSSGPASPADANIKVSSRGPASLVDANIGLSSSGSVPAADANIKLSSSGWAPAMDANIKLSTSCFVSAADVNVKLSSSGWAPAVNANIGMFSSGSATDTDSDVSSESDFADNIICQPDVHVLSECSKPSRQSVSELFSEMEAALTTLGDESTEVAIRGMMSRIRELSSTSALNSALSTFGADVTQAKRCHACLEEGATEGRDAKRPKVKA